jgi:hypothetical protein
MTAKLDEALATMKRWNDGFPSSYMVDREFGLTAADVSVVIEAAEKFIPPCSLPPK